jgi:four helix bundle protein
MVFDEDRQCRDLVVWQHAMGLARDIYNVTEHSPRKEAYGLTRQVCRAAVSVPSNIAESHGRLSGKSLVLFLTQARGSLYELETQLELAQSFGYAEEETCKRLLADSAEIGRMLNGLVSKLRETTHESLRVLIGYGKGHHRRSKQPAAYS